MTSLLHVKRLRDESVAARLRNASPLKWVPTTARSNEFRVFVSSYGGGYVQGDRIEMEVEVGPKASLSLESQGNQHLYNQNDAKRHVHQTCAGQCRAGSRSLILPQPTVMHEHVNFHQTQTWNFEADAEGLIVDAFHCGRSENGEAFAYDAFSSQITICKDNTPIFLDKFASFPQRRSAASPSKFGPYTYMVNVYGFGAVAHALQSSVFKQPDYHEIMGLHDLSGPHPNVDLPDVWLAQVVDEESGIFVTRILARRRLSVESFMEDLSQQSGAFLKQP